MNLGELIKELSKIGNQFASWYLIDSNVDSVELIGNNKEGYSVKVKLKQEKINDEELDDMATYNNPYPNTMREGDNWEAYMKGFKAGYRKSKEL